jgi:hypothetical protein
MKLSEIYLKRISGKLVDYIGLAVIDSELKAYGEICRLEGIMSEAKSVSRKRQFEKLLEKIAKENNLQ